MSFHRLLFSSFYNPHCFSSSSPPPSSLTPLPSILTPNSPSLPRLLGSVPSILPSFPSSIFADSGLYFPRWLASGAFALPVGLSQVQRGRAVTFTLLQQHPSLYHPSVLCFFVLLCMPNRVGDIRNSSVSKKHHHIFTFCG